MSPIRHRLPWHAKAAAFAVCPFVIAWLSAAALEIPGAPSTDALRAHARYLASDELMGRAVGTPGIKLARDYIAQDFATVGLRPGGDNGSYLQAFDVTTGVNVTRPTSLSVDGAGVALGEDWTPLGLSASGKTEGELLFAGYGITAREYGYDDYAGIDAKGKIVVVLRYEPPPKNPGSPFLGPPRYSGHATLRAKANNARDHGAAAMILVDLPHDGTNRDELISLGRSLWRGGKSLIAAQVTRRVVARWFETAGVSLAALKEKIDGDQQPASMPLPRTRVALAVTLQDIRARSENVIGILPGSDPRLKYEHIVIGAHYDHLGLGHYGALDPAGEGKIHPGADDNASGTAVLMRVAEELGRGEPQPARTLVFAAFSAEELGLLGSRHYVTAPPLPLSSARAMINLDMVGRLRDDRVTVFGARSAKELGPIVVEEARRLGLQVAQSDGIGPSDNMSFYSKQIPTLHFFTGMHRDYHRATDTADKLNYEGMQRISALVAATARRLAAGTEPLRFVKLPQRQRGAESDDGPTFRTYLGSIPDYGSTDDGVKLAGVSPGSPAAAAGLREGDVIVQFAGARIQNIEDLTVQLNAQKPGDKVEIVVRRGTQSVILNAVLRGRG